jgi:DNA-binding NarL/FixJ family response regulator
MTQAQATAVAAGAREPIEVAQLALAGHSCRVLCVDDVLPRHTAARNAARTRLLYAEGELAHFEFAGHIYAVVPQDAEAGSCAAGDASVAGDIRERLTNRELQIVQLICMGCITKQVADRLRISEFTVRSYLKTIYCKLGVRSRGAMVYRYAQAFQRAPIPVS